MAGTVAGENKSARPGILKRSALFFKDAWGELKRVRWPNRKELVSYTMVVLVTCLFVILLVFGFDAGIQQILRLVGLR